MIDSLAKLMADPTSITELSSAEINDLRVALSGFMEVLGTAYISARKREMEAAANPKAALGGLLDAGEIAQIMGVKKPVVYALFRHGALPFVQIGKYRKATTTDVERYLFRLRQEAEADRPRRKA
jgi:excisionase family DNA binding protein